MGRMLLPVGSQSIKVAQCPHMENMNNDARPVTVESALVSADEVRTTHSEVDRGKALKLGLGTRSTSAQQHSSRSSAPAGRPKEYLPAFYGMRLPLPACSFSSPLLQAALLLAIPVVL